MTDAPRAPHPRPWPARTGRLVWLVVGGGLLALAAANAHLLYVAVASQPDCVTHRRAGDASSAPGAYSAATSSCSPAAQARAVE
ncbi:MAG: hypothetical protein AB1586_05500 [Pseudomonadota bacterium]|jgi:hypothetical protein